MKRGLLFFFFLATVQLLLAQAQDVKLAQHYYRSGEYEKAAQLFKQLSEKSGYNDYYFNQYIESLIALERSGFRRRRFLLVRS